MAVQFVFDFVTACGDYFIRFYMFKTPVAVEYQMMIDEEKREEKRLLDSTIDMDETQQETQDSKLKQTSDLIMKSSGMDGENPYLSGLDKSLTPEQKELEQWKFLKHQMSMFTRVGFFIGGLLAGWGIFAGIILLSNETFHAIWRLDCNEFNNHVWHPDGLPAELFLGFHMLVTMFYITLYYFLYWMVPKWHNQVLKTESEVLYTSI
jgi:hypothetical protein